MKKSVVVVVCAAILAVGVAVPLGLRGMSAPEAALGVGASSTASVSDEGLHEAEGADELPATGLADSDDSAESDVVRDSSGVEYESGVVLVGLQDGVTVEQLNERLAKLDYIETKSLGEDDIAAGYAELKLADGVSVEEAESRIAADNADVIADAQPNYVYHLLDHMTSNASNDAAAGTWNGASLAAGLIAQTTTIDDAGQSKQWGLDAVGAYQAWDNAKTNGDVTVAILDTGIYSDHADLKDRIVGACSAETGRAFAGSADDQHGHGTHVAGIVAATANNGIGVAGVSYNASVMPVRVMDAAGNTDTAALAAGLNYVVQKADDYNVRVVNLSLGSEGASADVGDDAYKSAIKAVHDKGIVVVYAAGNEAEQEGGAYSCFPCDYDTDTGALGVISIAKSGSSYARSSFSNYNKSKQVTKDISAPGTDIYSTLKTGKYGEMSGTSMAAPFVSGIAALTFAANPNLTDDQVSSIIRSTAKDIGTTGWDRETGYGLVSASKAVAAAKAVKKSGWSSSYAPKKIISYATATLSATKYTYNGAAKKPGVTVTLGGTKLTKGTDYKVTYSNNTNAGTGKVVVTGIGSYTGTITKTFTIAKASLAGISLSTAKFAYNGAVRSPTVTVKGAKGGKSGQKLTKGTDYTLTTPSGRKSVGAYTYKAVGRGNYTGTKTTVLTINPKGTSVVSPIAASKALTARWKAQTAKMSTSVITGYQVQVATDAVFTKNTKSAAVKGYKVVSKKLTGLKASTKYYVRVRTYKDVSGKRYYSSWSATNTAVKTKA